MIGKKKVLLLIILIIVVFSCLWAFIAASFITNKFKKDINSQNLQQQKVNIDGLLLTETQDSKKLWEVFADTGYYDGKTQVIILEGIIGNFYQNGLVTASLKSDEGTYNVKTKEVILMKNSHVIYKDGTYIVADFINWKGKEEDVVAKNNVKIIKKDEFILSAQKAILTKNMTLFKLEGKVNSKIYSLSKGNIK